MPRKVRFPRGRRHYRTYTPKRAPSSARIGPWEGLGYDSRFRGMMIFLEFLGGHLQTKESLDIPALEGVWYRRECAWSAKGLNGKPGEGSWHMIARKEVLWVVGR
jgi:hypothetical protein